MEGNGGPRNTTTILQAALQELLDREERLLPFVDELAETRHAIKTLERALAPKAKGGSKRQADGREPKTAGTRDRIEAVLRESIEPLSREAIAEQLGQKRGVHLILASMVKDGRLVEIDGKYGLATTPVAAME